jgi:hypothetical protein
MPHLARLRADSFFAFAADRTVAALGELVEGRELRTSPRRQTAGGRDP